MITQNGQRTITKTLVLGKKKKKKSERGCVRFAVFQAQKLFWTQNPFLSLEASRGNVAPLLKWKAV